jgi:LytS/YehU family sensor histidine kinase
MLRLALEDGAGERVPLRHEFEFIECGATLLRARFQEHLDITIDCPESVRSALVPNLLWHTLIENAVKHHPGGRGTVIRVQARAEWADGWLHLHVRDNGPGITDLAQAMRQGVGLRNTQQRLQALYGPEHRLEFTNLPEGGLHAHAAFPAPLAA